MPYIRPKLAYVRIIQPFSLLREAINAGLLVSLNLPATLEGLKQLFASPTKALNDALKRVSRPLGLTQIELMERAAWARGESNGKILNHYAHAIENSRKAGSSPYNKGWRKFNKRGVKDSQTPEQRMKDSQFQDDTHSYPSILEHRNYKGFLEAYRQGSVVEEEKGFTATGKEAIKAIILARFGMSPDPTNGAELWQTGLPKSTDNATAVVTLTPKETDGKTYFYKWVWK